jgi:hypothetical protein
MTFSREAILRMDETSILMLQELAGQGSAIARETLSLIEAAGPPPAPETVVHVRWRMGPSRRGNGFYKVRYSSTEDGSRTLCGAPPTDSDMDWASTRFAKNLAYVTCGACKASRAEGNER